MAQGLGDHVKPPVMTVKAGHGKSFMTLDDRRDARFTALAGCWPGATKVRRAFVRANPGASLVIEPSMEG